jgi:hypothetical protein
MYSSKLFGFSRTVRLSAWLVSLSTVACAVATEPDAPDDDGKGGTHSSAGSSSSAGSITIAGSSSAFGGTSSETGGTSSMTAGTSSSAGTSSMGGSTSTAGTSSAGGKAGSGSGGKGGGTGAGGAAGSSSGGTTNTSGSGNSTSCSGVKKWVSADSTLTIAVGEVVQWMGKRYKATQAISYPNKECEPDHPVDWCKGWFTADGDC